MFSPGFFTGEEKDQGPKTENRDGGGGENREPLVSPGSQAQGGFRGPPDRNQGETD
jgi:hypothetical protein